MVEALEAHRVAVPARPFLKWAGGKTQLLPELLKRLPDAFTAYFEPFVGSGALFFALRVAGRIDGTYLSDANARLIGAYRAVRDGVEDVVGELMRFRNEREQYYEVRGWRHDDLPPALAAARIIYLNKTCYNGLYRENRKGQFNVPFGRYPNPTICDAENLRAVSRALHGVRLESYDFERLADLARPGDFIYYDPPYHPLSATSSFTAYHEDGFGPGEQERLAAFFREMDRRGVRQLLSNSDTLLIESLYTGYRVERVWAARAINSVAARRGKISELLIRNY